MKKWLSTVSLGFAVALVLLSAKYPTTEALPTNLRVTVIDNLGNFVEGAQVIIYANEDDYNADENPVSGPLSTDKKGRVTFKNLKPQAYYVDARLGDKTNIGEGVKTAPLQAGRINKVNTVIQ